MKVVTLHVDDQVYKNYQRMARRTKRSTSELIREAMENHQSKLGKKSLRLFQVGAPASVGKISAPWSGREPLLEGYWDRT